MEKIAKSNKLLKYCIHVAIAFVLAIIIANIKPIAPLTVTGMHILGITAGVVYAWCTTEMAWPALLGLLAVGFTDYCSVTDVLTGTAGNSIVLFILFLSIFGGIISQTGLCRQIALRLLTLKVAKGKPWMLTLLIMIAAAVPATIVGSFPVMFIMWGVMYDLFKIVGFKKGEKWPALIIILIASTSILGASFFPFSIGPVLEMSVINALSGGNNYVLPALNYSFFSLCFLVLNIAATMLVMRYIVKPDVSKLKGFELETQIDPLTAAQKIAVFLIGLLIVLMLLPSIVPASTAVGAFLASFGDAGKVMIVLGIAFLLRDKQGKPYVTMQKAASEGVSWDLIILVATVLFLGGPIGSEATGILPFLSGVLQPLFGPMNQFTFAIVAVIFATLCTNILDNGVTAFLAIPILYAVSVTNGFDILPIMALLIQTTLFGLVLPSSSPAAAMLYGNEEWLSRGLIVRNTLWLEGLFVVICVICYPIAALLL